MAAHTYQVIVTLNGTPKSKHIHTIVCTFKELRKNIFSILRDGVISLGVGQAEGFAFPPGDINRVSFIRLTGEPRKDSDEEPTVIVTNPMKDVA